MNHYEISSSLVGTRIRPLQVEITARQAMNFAASVFDDNRQFYDDTNPSELYTHPLIACALTWNISRQLERYLIADDFPHQVRQQQVHYTESLVWHQPMRPGDKLTIGGEIASIVPHRSGTHFVMRYDAINANNEPVFTEYTGAMLRGVQCTDSGFTCDGLPKPPESSVGSLIWSQELRIHPLAAHIYDGCADIHFPIHSSPAFAKSVGLPGIILHGTATLAYAVSELLRRELCGDSTRLQAAHCRFVGMVFPADSIQVELLGRQQNLSGTELIWRVLNQAGRPVIDHGRLECTTG